MREWYPGDYPVVMNSYDYFRTLELKARMGEDSGLSDEWFERAAKAVNNRIGQDPQLELSNEPDALKQELEELIQTHGS